MRFPALPIAAMALLVGAGAHAPAVLAAGAIAPCAEGGRDFCGFLRPEDLAPVDGSGRWLLVSQDSTDRPLVLLDTATGLRVDIPLPRAGQAAPAPSTTCPGLPQRIVAAGHDVRQVGKQLLAALVNRTAQARIELFEIDFDRRAADVAPRLRWRDCVPAPQGVALNDVALGPEGEIYVSQMFDAPRDAAAAAELRARFLAAEPTGRALRWSARAGWASMPGTEVSFANGIAVSNDGRWLAVAGTFDQAVVLVPLDGAADAALPAGSGSAAAAAGGVRRVALGLQPDNLTRTGAAGFVAAGHTGEPVTGIDPCRELREAPCGFPFAVSTIDAVLGVARRVLDDSGRSAPGASVAVAAGRALYLGSAFGDRVLFRETMDRSNEQR